MESTGLVDGVQPVTPPIDSMSELSVVDEQLSTSDIEPVNGESVAACEAEDEESLDEHESALLDADASEDNVISASDVADGEAANGVVSDNCIDPVVKDDEDQQEPLRPTSGDAQPVGTAAAAAAVYTLPTVISAAATEAIALDAADVLQLHDDATIIENAVPPEKLRAMLKTQLEYYFSTENLNHDKYLLTQMDRDQWVPISVVAGFNQVKKMTHRLDLVVSVLRESSVVEVDEIGERVRPANKRCTVILREIPQDTKIEDVQALFRGDGCPPFVDCVFAHNDSWYVTFNNEEEAQRAYIYLRETVRTFLGKPILARMKARPPLAVSTASYVQPGQNGVVSPQYEIPAATAIPLATKCAYTPLPAVQYIQHPAAYPLLSPTMWPTPYFLDRTMTQVCFSADMFSQQFSAAVTAGPPLGYFNANNAPRSRPRRGSGSFRGGLMQSSDRHNQLSTPPGGDNGMSSAPSLSASTQPPRFSRRHNEPHGEPARPSAARSPGLQHAGGGNSNAVHVANVSHNRHSASVSANPRGGASGAGSNAAGHDRLGASRAVSSAGHMNHSPQLAAHDMNGHDSGPAPAPSAGYSRGPQRESGGSSYTRRGGGGNRGRRKPYQEDGLNVRTDTRKAPEAEHFELEPTSFPPLPGGSMPPATNVFHETPIASDSNSKTLSDIVKSGAARPPPPPVTSGAADRSNHVAPSPGGRPRPSPGERSSPASSSGSATIGRNRPSPAASAVDRSNATVSTSAGGSKPRVSPAATSANNVHADVANKVTNNVTSPANRISRSTSTDSLVTSPLEPTSAVINSTVSNNTADSTSSSHGASSTPTQNSISAVDDTVKLPPKLSYAQIAQRTKEANESATTNAVEPSSRPATTTATKEPVTPHQSHHQNHATSGVDQSKCRSNGPIASSPDVHHHHGGPPSSSFTTPHYKHRPNAFATQRSDPRSPRTYNGVATTVATEKHVLP